MVKVLPELNMTMQHLWDNRETWNEKLLAELGGDVSKVPIDRVAEQVCRS